MNITFLLAVRTSYRDEFLSELSKRGGHDITALYLSETAHWRDWHLDPPEYRSQTIPGLSLGGRNGGFTVALNRRVRPTLAESSPDVLVLGGYALPAVLLAMFWAAGRCIPYIILSESNDLKRRGLRSRVARPVARAAVNSAGALLATSTPAKAYLEQMGAPPTSVFVLPNAPDVRRLAAEVDTAQRISRPRPPTALFVGRLIEAKGLKILLQAWMQVSAVVPHARLIIAGTGPLRDELEETCRKQHFNFSFPGFCEPNDLPALYASADVFVLPSRFEPYGVVLLEAMASALPVIVSDAVGSAPDLVTEGTGVVFPSGDASALAEALIMMLSDEGGRVASGWEARKSALRWDMDYCVSAFEKAINCAAAQHIRPAHGRE